VKCASAEQNIKCLRLVYFRRQ